MGMTVKRSMLFGLIALILGLFFAALPASAAINEQINFQGKITNPNGTNVTNGSYNFTFSIYTVSSGGTAAWTETKSLTVTDGIFQTALGDTTAFGGSVDFNNASLYLGITVGADPEMTPRVRLTSAPYAFNSGQLNGLGSSSFVQLAQGLQVDASTTNASIAINKTGGTAGIMQLQRAGSDVLAIANSGAYTYTLSAANNPAYTIVNNGSGNIITNLAASGDFLLQDNGATFFTITDTGAFDISLDATDNPTFTVTNSGSGAVTYNLAGTGDFFIQDNGVSFLTISDAGAYDFTLDATDNPAYTITNAGSGNVVTNLTGTGDFIIEDNGADILTVTDTGGVIIAASAAGDVLLNQAAGSNIQVIATAAPTTDQVSITNAGQPVTTSGVNGLSINYVGGAAAVEASGARVDLTPGTTTGGTWNGIRIVANATGATTGVTENGIKLEGPTSPGAGTEVGMVIDANWDSGLQIGAKTSDPGTPAANNIYVFARQIAGRSMLRQKGPSGVSFAYQPSLFEQAITYVGPSTGTATTSFGSAWTVDTTLSHPAVTETYGYIMNYATAATANDTAGVGQTNTQFFRGSTSGSNGFFHVARIALPDANYGTGATGARVFTGLTSNTIAAMTNADSPTGDYAGFQYSTNRGDTNWQFLMRDNTTTNTINTTMAFTVAKVYDLYIYTPPQGTVVYWRIDNLTDGTTQEGSSSTNMPRTTIAMRAGSGLQTLTTTARNLRVAKIYVESDR